MKSRIIATAAVVGLLAALAAGDVSAAGKGKQHVAATATQTATTAPVGSQRKDGTFLTTGTTANGSTTRQGNGTGLMDGSRLAVPATPATVTTTTP